MLKQLHALFLPAWRSFRANAVRSALTMFGTVIGVAAVLLVVSVGKGAESLIVSQVQTIGTNLIGILPGKSEANGPPAAVLGIIVTTLTRDDVQELEKLPGVVAATGYVSARAQFITESKTVDSSLYGVEASFPRIEETTLVSGRFFSEQEVGQQARVLVLGAALKTSLFGDADPLGARVRFKGVPFTVIGVMAPRGSSLFGDQDDRALAPMTTVQGGILGIKHVNFARAKYEADADSAQLIASMERLLRQRHRITDPERDDFSVRSTAQGVEILTGITQSIQGFLMAIVAISLLVGGIGIMNIMLVVINERVREIGLRKAVGARAGNLFAQFLLESAFVSVIGGLIGVVLGFGLAYAAALGLQYAGFAWEMRLSPWDALFALLVAGLVGALAGVYPSLKAARLQPTEALRNQ